MTLTKIIHNVETNEIAEVELTSSEIAELKKQQEAQAILDEKENEVLAAKESQRQILLDKLGITEEEAKLLLG